MDWAALWAWLSDPEHQKALTWLGGGAAVVIGAAWTLYTFHAKRTASKTAPSSEGSQTSEHLVHSLLRYGFLLTLVVTLLGFGLRYVALQNGPELPPAEHTAPSAITAESGGMAAGRNVIRDITQTGPGIIHIGDIHGISEERFQALSEELGVRKAALKGFFKILEREEVPREELDSTLRKIAARYKELDQKLATFTSADPAVNALKAEARAALETGNLERAETLLKQAKEKDIRAAKAMQEAAHTRWLSAAASAKELGDLKLIELAYADAAAYYHEAAQLVPSDEEELLAAYLNEEGVAFFEAGKYGEAQAPVERALTIREKALGPEHPHVAISLNNLAGLYDAQGRYAEAEPLYQRSLAIVEKALGAEHPDTITVRNNYAALREKLDQPKEAQAAAGE